MYSMQDSSFKIQTKVNFFRRYSPVKVFCLARLRTLNYKVISRRHHICHIEHQNCFVLKNNENPNSQIYTAAKVIKASTVHFTNIGRLGAHGWLSQLSAQLWLRSWSHSLWVQAPHGALGWQLRAWSLRQILSLSLPFPTCVCVCVSLSKINIKTFF